MTSIHKYGIIYYMKKRLIVTVLMVFITIMVISSGCISAESSTNESVMEDHMVVIADEEVKYDLSWHNGGTQNFTILKQKIGLPLFCNNNGIRGIIIIPK